MTEQKTPKPFVPKKSASPFNNDPYNTRGGKAGKGGKVAASSGNQGKMKTINAPKFKGGSGGDR